MITKEAKMERFRSGQRVKLTSDTDGSKEEFGVIRGYCGNDLYYVQVDEKFRVALSDDGTREVLADYIVSV